MTEFIHIRTQKFPVLEGEEDELVNPGMYGKACGQFVKEKLELLGYQCSEPFCEDWGWAVTLESQGVRSMVCIYAAAAQEQPEDYACTIDNGSRIWSWRKFRFVNQISLQQWNEQARSDLLQIFNDDPDIQISDIAEEFPI